jgi:hypothetical protein
MKTITAVLTSFVIFVVVWLTITAIMTSILYIAHRAAPTAGIMAFLHVVLTWILGTSIGAFFAIHITNRIFLSVDIKTVYISFISIVLTVSIILFVFAARQYTKGYYNINIVDFVGFVVQLISFFIGAYCGIKSCVHYCKVSDLKNVED